MHLGGKVPTLIVSCFNKMVLQQALHGMLFHGSREHLAQTLFLTGQTSMRQLC